MASSSRCLLAGLILLAITSAGRTEDVWPPKLIRIASNVSGHIPPAACVSLRGTVVVIFSSLDWPSGRNPPGSTAFEDLP